MFSQWRNFKRMHTTAPSFDFLSLIDLNVRHALKRSKYYNLCHSFARSKNNDYEYDQSSYLPRDHKIAMVESAQEAIQKLKIDPLKLDVNTRMIRNDKAFFSHTYLVLRGHSEPLIVDVLLRTLFITPTNENQKILSPYANKVFDCIPPVWIGTPSRLSKLCDYLEVERKKDNQHNSLEDDAYVGNTMIFFINP